MGCFEIVSAFVFAFLVKLPDWFGDAQRFSVERGLGDEAIWKRQSKNTGYTGSQSEEKQIPVEASRLAQWKFTSLGNQRRNYLSNVS
jgi:hypothetical protein